MPIPHIGLPTREGLGYSPVLRLASLDRAKSLALSFPRKRESTPQVAPNPLALPFLATGCHWILCGTLLLRLGLVPLIGRERSRRALGVLCGRPAEHEPKERRGEVWECWERFGGGGERCGRWISPHPWRSIPISGTTRRRSSGVCPARAAERAERELKGPEPSSVSIKAPAGATLILGLAWAAHPDAPLHTTEHCPTQSLAMRAPPRLPAWIMPVSALPQLDASQSEEAFQSSAKRPTAVWRRLLTVPTGIRSIPAISA